MGWSEMEGRCKRHPSHRQSKGVCPTCLREKLSQISASSSGLSSPGTSYDSVSSAASSSSSSPATARRASAAAKITLMVGKPEPLTKSRSLAFVVTGGKRDKKGKSKEEEEEEKRKKATVAAAAAAEEEEREVEAQKEATAAAAAAAAAAEVEKKKKRGFWSRLAIPGKKKREKDVLFHSKTVRETSSARWASLS
ncbi:unnamed protein product [Spirodela intermedia]|uniref:Uncharacterized protein n=1 Tax=Spirodela intermedia TaxID=51605 RepID=A0A7I8KSZ4_SPIIN|nr:unnamed protein product [Spirodela intermedia]